MVVRLPVTAHSIKLQGEPMLDHVVPYQNPIHLENGPSADRSATTASLFWAEHRTPRLEKAAPRPMLWLATEIHTHRCPDAPLLTPLYA
jgi:hypothetical protein